MLSSSLLKPSIVQYLVVDVGQEDIKDIVHIVRNSIYQVYTGTRREEGGQRKTF